jgi:hypothetical protein
VAGAFDPFFIEQSTKFVPDHYLGVRACSQITEARPTLDQNDSREVFNCVSA